MNIDRELTARVFDIEQFGLEDGPGIRMVVFFKGCSLRCRWCHNPESQHMECEMMFSQDRCLQCGACKDVCPSSAIQFDQESTLRVYLPEKCSMCCRCMKVCPQNAIDCVGYDIPLSSLVNKIIRAGPFHRRSGGGVTLSGGEPLLQVNLCKEFLRSCHEEGIHVAIDTSGHVGWAEIKNVLADTDLFLYDIKHLDSKKHQEWTGKSNQLILGNLERLVSAKANRTFSIIIRIPVVPGFNDTPIEINDILSFVKDLGRIDKVEVLPFHFYGKIKYQKLRRPYPMENYRPPEKDFLQKIKKMGEEKRLDISICG